MPVGEGLSLRVVAPTDRFQRPPQNGVALIVLPRGVAGLLGGMRLLLRHPEEEEVVLPHQITDLDIGTVQSADRECAVEGELHVPRSRGLLAGKRDLL